MDWLLAALARGLVWGLQTLPLRGVARLGRALGGLMWLLDARHRRVALSNLEACFGDRMSSRELQALAREHFRQLGENYACGVKTAGMTAAALAPHLAFRGSEKIQPWDTGGTAASRVVAIGHFGNFELYARFGQFVPGVRCATTYRGLRQPRLDQLVQRLREGSGCLFFERRRDGPALRSAMSEAGLLLGLLADQHAGDSGLRMMFLGRECSTSTAPAVFALRYRCPLHTAICFRTGLASWQIEIGDEIPTVVDGQPRGVGEIMADVNRCYEAAIRRDPANWFWVHRRWKPAPPSRHTTTERPPRCPAPPAGTPVPEEPVLPR